MLRGDDLLQIIDLRGGQLLPDAAAIAAINQRDRAREHLLWPGHRFMFGQRMANQFGDKLRARGQPAFLDHHVELAEQIRREAHTEAGKAGWFGCHG